MSGIKYESIPVDPENNTAGKAILSLLDTLESKQGFKVHIEKGIPPGSGIGSSSASAAAVVVMICAVVQSHIPNVKLQILVPTHIAVQLRNVSTAIIAVQCETLTLLCHHFDQFAADG